MKNNLFELDGIQVRFYTNWYYRKMDLYYIIIVCAEFKMGCYAEISFAKFMFWFRLLWFLI